MRTLFYLLLLALIASCAKIPTETITLANVISEEGKRMHDLNIMLVNKMFKEKSEKIDEFIKDEYTPKYLENILKGGVEAIKKDTSTTLEKEIPNLIESAVLKISSRRNMMQSALESQRVKLVTKLDLDYSIYEESSMVLLQLIESAVKVNEERTKAFDQIKKYSQNKIDLNKVDSELDAFILKAGGTSKNVSGDINDLDNSINSLLNK